MSDIAIRAENLGKRYRIGERAPYYALRDVLARSLNGPYRRWRDRTRTAKAPRPGLGLRVLADQSYIWALKDLSLEIKRGEVVGIIGHNGAGKSTLLKILSRITKPTEGEVRLSGRIGSLLEVGTGFHPELSGRENVYLNGAILGMRKAEIYRKFDEIVAFAEVENFIDTPVKHYSSGMCVRLAFAVAAHLEPEILLVDEVLAVGDATYQRKCIDRMATLASTGKTVLVVSHNMDLIPRLCAKAILLERGRLRREGASPAIVEEYLANSLTDEEANGLRRMGKTGNGRARFTKVQLLGPKGNRRFTHACGHDLILRMEIEANTHVTDVALAVILKTLSGTRIISSWTREVNFPVTLNPGRQIYQCHFERVNLRPGHSVSLGLWMEAQGEVLDSLEDARIIQVSDGEGTQNLSTERHQGVIVCDYSWSRVEPSVSGVDILGG